MATAATSQEGESRRVHQLSAQIPQSDSTFPPTKVRSTPTGHHPAQQCPRAVLDGSPLSGLSRPASDHTGSGWGPEERLARLDVAAEPPALPVG